MKLLTNKLWDEVLWQVSNQVRDQVWVQVWNGVHWRVSSQLYDEIEGTGE